MVAGVCCDGTFCFCIQPLCMFVKRCGCVCEGVVLLAMCVLLVRSPRAFSSCVCVCVWLWLYSMATVWQTVVVYVCEVMRVCVVGVGAAIRTTRSTTKNPRMCVFLTRCRCVPCPVWTAWPLRVCVCALCAYTPPCGPSSGRVCYVWLWLCLCVRGGVCAYVMCA